MTDSNIETKENPDISENGNFLDNGNNNEVDNIINNDILEEDEENSDIIDDDIVNGTEIKDDATNTDEGNEEKADEEDEYFSSIEDIYNSNIDVLSSVNSIKNDINERLMIRKLKLAKENDGLKLMFEIIFYFFMFFYIKSCTNELLSQILSNSNLAEKGFIFKTTIFILKKLHIIVFLLFTNIGHIFFDILLLFFVEIIDVLVFILDRFDYNIITKEREIRKLKDSEENKDGNKNNQDSSKDNSYMMIVIKGVLYILVNGILVPLSMLLKSINKSIAISGNRLSDLFLLKKDLLIKRQPNMDIKKSRLINSLEGKQPTKDKNINKKRSLFDRFRTYLNRIVERNGLLTNSLRDEGKKPKMSKITGKTLGIKGGRNSSRGKGTSRGRNGWERSLEGKERSSSGKETDTKGKDNTTSKEQGKSTNNRGEVKEENKQTGQETTTRSGQKRDDNSFKSNLHDSTTIDNQSRKETAVQQRNPTKPDNLNQGVGAGNTTKTGDTTKESPKPVKQPSNFDFSNKKMSEDFINKIERYELLVNGKVYDFNKDGQCAGMPLDEAKKFAAERSKGLENLNKGEERLENFKEKENQSKNLSDNKKQGQPEQVDVVISDSVGAVDGDKNKGDVTKGRKDQIVGDADKLIETFNKQSQEKEQINESPLAKKLKERKSKQQENAPQNDDVTKGLKGVYESNSQDRPGVKNEWREKFSAQTGNNRSQSINSNQIG